jgi:flagellar biosynthesis component FlhA
MTPSQAMPATFGKGPHAAYLKTLRELAVPLAVLGIVMALVTPLPSFLLDLMLSCWHTAICFIFFSSLHMGGFCLLNGYLRILHNCS